MASPTSIPSYESSPPLHLGPGVTLRFYYTPSYPSDSPYKRYTETTYDPTVPNSRPLSVPAHWHILHDEHLSVVEGEMTFFLGLDDGMKAVIAKPGMEPTFAPKRTVHAMQGRSGVRTILREGTSFGSTRDKESFLRHAFVKGRPDMWTGIRASMEGDAYMVCTVWGYHSALIDMIVIIFLGTVAKFFAPPKPILPDEQAYLENKP